MLGTKMLRIWSLNQKAALTRFISSTSSGSQQTQSQPKVREEGPKVPRVRVQQKEELDWRTEVQPPKEFKPSFGKELFLGKFDTDLLTFPESLEKEQLETLNEMMVPIEKFFKEQGTTLT